MKKVWSHIRSNPALATIIVIAVATVVVRSLLRSSFHGTALLYVAIPFFTTLAILQCRPPAEQTWTTKYLRAMRASFIVLFAVSIALYEGYLCVIMFIPVYMLMSIFAMACEYVWRRTRRRSSGMALAYALPAIALIASLEGTHTRLSFDRYNEVIVSETVEKPLHVLRENIGRPFDMQGSRGGLLQLFPMPDRIAAGSLTPGAVHEVHYTYRRWFVTNVHQGRTLLEIGDVGDRHVTTRILHDTSYIASYLRLRGTRIELTPIDARTTRVELTAEFDRLLDPGWYFGPLQRYAVSEMAEFLIQEVIVR